MRLFKFVCKEGESLVYFDHVLDVVECGYRLAVDFAHTCALGPAMDLCVGAKSAAKW